MFDYIFIVILINSVQLTVNANLPFFLNQQSHRLLGFNINNNSDAICGDFYEFSCKTWISDNQKPTYEVVWSPWIEANHNLNRKLSNIIKSTNNDAALGKCRRFYESCVHNPPIFETKYLRDLRQLIKNFKGWPLITDCSLKDYNWLAQLMRISRFLGIFPIIKTHVDIDYKNTSKYIIYIEPGDLIYPRHILTNPSKYPLEIEAYAKWIRESVRHIYFKRNDNRNIETTVRNIINLEVRLAQLKKRSKNERISIGDLTKRLPINWLQSLRILFDGSGVELDETDRIIIRNYHYLKDLFMLLKKIQIEDIANYMIWTVVRDLSRETTSHMRKLNFFVDRTVLGIESDLSRHDECLSNTIDFFSHALIPQLSRDLIKNPLISDVEEMILSIKTEYYALINNSQWLSREARYLSLEKARNLRYFIGYPKWSENSSETQKYYREIDITDNHLTNVLKIKSFRMRNQLKKLKSNVNDAEWPSTPFEVNAFYSILQNAIFVPMGLLQPPFVKNDRSKVFNYGALGTLIGHEITHSLDNLGRQADKNGIIKKWWPSKDIKTYEERAKCFESQYSTSGLISETIADNVGLELSLKAYKRLNLRHRHELKLFFISFAQMWCEVSDNTRIDLLSDDEHGPVKNRVNWTLHNNEDFSREFQCNLNEFRCKIW